LSVAEVFTLETALRPLHKLNCNLKLEEVRVVEFLGIGVEGCVEDGEIYIARTCLAKGVDWLSSTLYEEWVHKTMGYTDKSLGLQQFLFDKIFQLVKELP
jgi:hypothetical protein